MQSDIGILKGGFQYKLSNDAGAIIPYPTFEEKHIWQVYVTSELKIKLFYFFTIEAMVGVFIAVKNRYLNFLSLRNFATTQNEPKGVKMKQCNPQPATEIHDQFFLTMSTIKQALTILLLMEKALFTWAFRSWVSFFKCLQEFKERINKCS